MEKLLTPGSRDHQMVGEFLRIMQRYWIAETTDDYWDSLLDATEALNQKYSDPMLLSLIVGFVGAKEDEYRKLQGKSCIPTTMKWKRVER